MTWENELNRLFQDLVDVTLLWDRVGTLYGHLEAPWVPTPYEVIEVVLDLVSIGSGDIIFDLGCGDGRVVIEAAKKGAKGVCIEIDNKLVEIAQIQAREQGVEDRIIFINNDIMNVDLSSATIIYMYLTTNMVKKLRNKLLSELRSGTMVISLDYDISWLQPIDAIELNLNNKWYKVYLYII